MASGLPRLLMFPRLATTSSMRALHLTPMAKSGGGDWTWGPERAAGREIVGHGNKGDPVYVDRLDYWYPAIRFRKDDATIAPIRAKEKGDWNKLSTEEKKLLYRYSFRATLSEFLNLPPYYKPAFAWAFLVLSLAMFYSIFLHKFVFKALPETFTPEWKEAMLQRAIDLHAEPITGVASKYDYEKKQWKA